MNAYIDVPPTDAAIYFRQSPANPALQLRFGVCTRDGKWAFFWGTRWQRMLLWFFVRSLPKEVR
jgi:hypothetical protein